MQKLRAIIEPTDDGFWAYFPDLPSVVSYGKTVEEIKIIINDALNEYIKASGSNSKFKEPITVYFVIKSNS